MIGYLGLGSNVGDRLSHLRAARDLLASHGAPVTASSSVYETEPVGEVLDQRDFFNACVRVETELGPEQLLDACKAVEHDLGREQAAPRHGPRLIDVDLLLLDELRYVSERLTIPHPEILERRFVLVPLLELAPDVVLPGGPPLAEVLEALGPERVELVGAL